MLDAQAAVVDDAVVLAHVARGEDPLDRGLQAPVAGDAAAVSELEADLAGEHDVRRHADADDDEVGVDPAPVLADHGRDRSVVLALPRELDDVRTRDDLDAVARQQDDAISSQDIPQEARWVIPEIERMRSEEMLAIVRSPTRR